VGSFCPEASKRRKLEVEVAEDGVMELCVEYNRYVLCGRRGRVWGGTCRQRKEGEVCLHRRTRGELWRRRCALVWEERAEVEIAHQLVLSPPTEKTIPTTGLQNLSSWIIAGE